MNRRAVFNVDIVEVARTCGLAMNGLARESAIADVLVSSMYLQLGLSVGAELLSWNHDRY